MHILLNSNERCEGHVDSTNDGVITLSSFTMHGYEDRYPQGRHSFKDGPVVQISENDILDFEFRSYVAPSSETPLPPKDPQPPLEDDMLRGAIPRPPGNLSTKKAFNGEDDFFDNLEGVPVRHVDLSVFV